MEPHIILTDDASYQSKPNGSTTLSKKELRAMATSVLLERVQFMRQHGLTFSGARDEYEVFGYDRIVTTLQYRSEYARGGIAGRIVDCYPNATWRGEMEIIEDEDPEVFTEFEKKWDEFDTRLQVRAKMHRVDKLSQLSTYAVILIGAPGALADELPKGKSIDEIVYLQPFMGGGGTSRHNATASLDTDCTVFEYEVDPENPRFGQPKLYQLKRTDFYAPVYARPVHWSRIVHVAENMLDDEVHGQPRLERVWNLLCDLRKVTGGGAEAFWLRANQGLHIDVDKDMAVPDASFAIEKLKEQQLEYKHQLDRWLRTKGTDVNVLGSDVANFEAPADAIITQISGALGIPKRILTGSEMGELASSQDRDNWRDQVNGRQTGHAAPYIVRPLVDRLIQYGYLPQPLKGPKAYEVRWPNIVTLTEDEKVKGGQGWASINQTYGDVVFTKSEIREKWGDKPPLSDEQLKEIEEEVKAKQALEPKPEPPVIMAPSGKPVAVPKKKKEEEEPKAAQEGPHEYASTQVQIPNDLAEQIYTYGQTIPEEDLDPEQRVETDIHCTICYGLESDDPEAVRGVVENFGPIDFTLDYTNVFETPQYDVLHIVARGLDLDLLHERIKSLPNTQTYPRYRPHVTVAYLKPGKGANYINDERFAGSRVSSDTVTFVSKDGTQRTPIKVTSKDLRTYEDPIDEEIVRVLAEAIKVDNQDVIQAIVGRSLGGPGSGNFGHAGRPGLLGGSSSRGGSLGPIPFDTWDPDDPDLFVDTLIAMIDQGEIALDKVKRFTKETKGKLRAVLDRVVGLRTAYGTATSGNYGHAGRPGEVGGSAPGQGGIGEFRRLYKEFTLANQELSNHIHKDLNDPERKGAILRMRRLAKQMHRMDVDPGGIEGIGLPGQPHDVLIVGAGPGGLTAAINGGFERLDTMLVEARPRPGGQPLTSPRIENHPGYPAGVSGRALAADLTEQAERNGAKLQFNRRVVNIEHDEKTGLKMVEFDNGERITARTVILAGGAETDKLTFPGSDKVNWGDAELPAIEGKGQSVVIVGGGNAAAQAALGAAKTAAKVTIVSRSKLSKNMSRSKEDELRFNPKVEIIEDEGDEMAGWDGDVLRTTKRTIPAKHVAAFLPNKSRIEWLPESIKKDKGRVNVDPHTFETSMPGVFAIGDMSNAAGGGVGGAAGHGRPVIGQVFNHLKKLQKKASSAN